MKTVNKGPQIFLDHKIIQSKAHQLNISFAFKLSALPSLPSPDPPDPTVSTQTPTHVKIKPEGHSGHPQSSQTKTWQACTTRILEWARSTIAYGENPLRRKTPLGPGRGREHP